MFPDKRAKKPLDPADWVDDPAFKHAAKDDFKHAPKFRSVLVPEIWLPVVIPFLFRGVVPHRDEVTLTGSVGGLLARLVDMKEAVRAEARKRLPAVDQAFEALAAAAAYAKASNLPMILDT